MLWNKLPVIACPKVVLLLEVQTNASRSGKQKSPIIVNQDIL